MFGEFLIALGVGILISWLMFDAGRKYEIAKLILAEEERQKKIRNFLDMLSSTTAEVIELNESNRIN